METLTRVLAVVTNVRVYHVLMLKMCVVALLAVAMVLALEALADGTGQMDRTFLFLFGASVGFVLGYNVRAIVSVRRRREMRRIREAHERLLRIRASRNQIDVTAGPE